MRYTKELYYYYYYYYYYYHIDNFDLQIPSPITVTIGLDWDVSTVGKPIPANYTTQVTLGTVLVDILNKAAESDANSPFNRYQCTYSAGLGRSITAMNGVPQVCICSLHLCLLASASIWPVFTNGASAKLINSFLNIEPR